MRINEIFYSIQGEASFAGQPCIFVRLAGCNLRCRWCDTTYAYDEGSEMPIDAIIGKVASYDCDLVEITGGEPMCQHAEACALMMRLIELRKTVLLETNGSQPLDDVPEAVHRIIDLKPPKSGTDHDRQIWSGYARSWRATDEVKCVVADRGDFDWCVEKLHEYGAFNHVIIHFSPVWGELKPADLASWICDAHLPIRLNLQLQKIIWDPNARGV